MSEKARKKRAMRIRGEKRVKTMKPKGLSPHATPMLTFTDSAFDTLTDRYPAFPLEEHDPWLGRMGLSEENIENAGAGLQYMDEVIHGPRTHQYEDQYAGDEDTGTGDELETREVQGRAGDNETVGEEGTDPSEPADD